MEKHNHGKNFGRFVQDCPRCLELHPDGPPQKVAKAKESSETNELLKLLIRREEAALARQDEEQRKREDDAARKEAAKAQLRADIERDAHNKLAAQMACAHQMPNGHSARTDGQIHNDGMFHPFCQICQYHWPPRAPYREEQQTVVTA